MKSPAVLLAAFLLAAPMLLAQESYGTIRATTKIGPDGTKCTTKLDPDKHTAEETITDASTPPRVLKKTTYLLGEGNVAIGAIFFDAKNNVIYQATYQRDGAGHITEAAFNSPNGQYLGKRVFVYGSGETATQVIDYDANGQAIAQTQQAAPKSSRKKNH